jgi:hypothetical protein
MIIHGITDFKLTLESVVLTILHPLCYSNYDLYSSAVIIRVIKLKRIWVGPGSTMVERRGVTGFWCGNLREKGHLEDLHGDGTIILQWIFKKLDRDMDRFVLAHTRDRRRTVVNAVMSFRVL